MMLYLTGAQNSLAKSQENPQSDASRSLGGYISSSAVPNAALNVLFDLISSYTLDKRPKETIALGLINQFPKPVKDVELKIVGEFENEATFKVAAVEVGSDYSMEQIANRYQEPMLAEFHDATFFRAAVDIEVKQYASIGEEIALFPFNVSFKVKEDSFNGTWKAFEEAFSDDETYKVRRISEKVFRIERRDESVVESPIKCSYVSTGGFSASFLGEFQNQKTNSVIIKNEIKPKEAVGLWVQRLIKPNNYPTNEQILKEFKDKIIRSEIENVELVISYQFVEETEENI